VNQQLIHFLILISGVILLGWFMYSENMSYSKTTGGLYSNLGTFSFGRDASFFAITASAGTGE